MQPPSSTNAQPTVVPQRSPLRWLEIRLVTGFYLLLFALNALRAFLLYPFEHSLSMTGIQGDLIATTMDGSVKAVLWVGLTFIVIHFGERSSFLEATGLKGNYKKGLLAALVGCLIVVGVQALPVLLHQTSPHTPPDSFFTIFFSILAGPIEEIAFRGYLLQKLLGWMDEIVAMGVNALLFALIHIPLWLAMGSGGQDVLWSFLSILPISLLFCGAFVWSRSLWSSMLLHSFYNFTQLFFT